MYDHTSTCILFKKMGRCWKVGDDPLSEITLSQWPPITSDNLSNAWQLYGILSYAMMKLALISKPWKTVYEVLPIRDVFAIN